MKKNILYTLIINYLVFFIYTLSVIIKKISFSEFINRSIFLLIALNIALFIFFNIILKNINKVKNSIDIAIPPIESDIKDILNDPSGQVEENNDEFEELNWRHLDE
ncbi:hypothetical protein [Tepidibacter formicigenes]|jgi:hypothetical protein|uniref:Uncharacterized protein n=1 Tax=Tepidibacter formicigenes DSM 15518 TaxID=1123349 RepID=A0A1M6JB44_9FIRM|nr:hypothetical protein [Tepidibacter formicigenes]SHJ43929.1 hypothetical protein SAMN02744037_00055 [Tepidibacter formicigenes DSM 15518]